MTRARVVVSLGVAALLAVAFVVLPTWSGIGSVLAAQPVQQPPAADVAATLAAPTPAYRTESREVGEGELAGEVLRAMGLDAATLVPAAAGRFDKISPGDRFTADWRTGEDKPFRVRLAHDPAQTVELVRSGDRYVSRVVPVPYRTEELAAAVTVTSSLWAAATEVGFSPQQILGLAKIFEYDVDFNTELVEKARFRFVLDRLTADDGSQRVGDIRAAILDNGGKTYVAIRYTTKDGTTAWFGKDGAARRKTFLRSPLEFSRVTSGFTTGRYHPILHRMRAHKGVDLAAPTGTPVRAAADGVVARAGWAGGHGNHVELKHDGGYATGYSHLSFIGVKAGEHVHQGEVIGRVGTTGLSTGPHLHYEFLVNGVNKDPMKSIVPIAQPLPDAEKPDFFKVRDALLPMLEGATELAASPARETPEQKDRVSL